MKVFYHFSKDIAIRIDKLLGTSIKESGGRVYRYLLRQWSPVRRVLDPVCIRLRYKIWKTTPHDLRLHLGCGWKHFQGYVNVDIWITDATDVICDITKLPWPDNSVSVIENYHVIEHISYNKIRDTLAEWHRVLSPGGTLILECPHFDIAVGEYLEGNEYRLINIFGQQRNHGDVHLYGYNPSRLIRLLGEIGFGDFTEPSPQSSQSLDEPSFRIECKKDSH
jgi:SAM-dependent methyltransferase